MDQLMSGSWSILPLGQRVVTKINNIIRQEINAVGGQELALPLLHPKEIWNETGRWETAREVMYQLKDTREKEYALSFTHEEIVMDLLRKKIFSYKDLPVYVYQFSTKFRNELRATGGILRGREFLMKDLYSAHASEADLTDYYQKVKESYLKIFKRLGLKVKVTEASGGVFTEKRTHEFQVINSAGEDTIYFCNRESCEFGQNKEVFDYKVGEPCPICKEGIITEDHSIEVGNIFPLGIKKYAEKMGFSFTDKDGSKKPVWFGSYGIGPTRVMGTIVEEYHDDKGIIWPESVAPYQIHIVDLENSQLTTHNSQLTGEAIYNKLSETGVEVLWDDRSDVSAGQKFADADLVGVPYRLVVSEKSLEKGGLEIKKRSEEGTQIINLDQLLQLSLGKPQNS